LFPARGCKPFVFAWEFSEGLQCTRVHTLDLVREKLLRLVPDTKIEIGRGNETVLEWEAVKGFLQAARVTAENPEGRR